MLKQGQVLNNRYQIHAVLGEGGFGAVYKVWDDNLQRHCAIKENLQVTPESQKQFKREAIMLANLNHPHLVRVTDYFIIANQGQYLVMDFVEGDNLETILIQNGGPLPNEQALAWIGQVCDALIYIHNQSPPIIHRDIKPANIRITPQGNAVLVDFGLAKIFEANAKTSTGARGLTPYFAAPEQYGMGGTDAQSDIYSLGVTLYCMLTNHVPADSVDIMVGNAEPPPPAKAINKDVPEFVSNALQRAMQLRRTDRYKSASDLKTALLAEQKPFAQVKVVESPKEQQKFEIRDLRLKTEMLRNLASSTLIWAEGADKVKGKSRFELYHANELAIWTTPPSPVELHAALEIVKPKVVYVFAVPPAEEKPDDFLNRLAGLCKYAINQRGGRVRFFEEFAAAMAAQMETVRLGLEWLKAGGHLQVEEEQYTAEAGFYFSAGSGESNSHLQQELFIKLKGLLEKTVAYRRLFATTDDLKELFTRLPRQTDHEVPKPVQVITPPVIKDVSALTDKGNGLLKLGRYEEAIRFYDKVLEIDPRNVNALFNKGNSFSILGRYEEAIIYYDKVLEIDPHNVNTLNIRGACLDSLSRYEESIHYYDRALEINPRDILALVNKGSSLGSLGRYEDAIRCFDKVLEIDPRDVDALLNKGNSLNSLGRYEDAIRCFDKVLEIDPRDVDALLNKGNSLNSLGRYEEAIRYFDKALEIDPRDVNALNNKGNGLLKLGRYEEAIRYFDKALEIDPRNETVLNNKGISLASLGRYEESIRCFDKALKIDPNNVAAMYGKSIGLDNLGRNRDAAQSYRQFLALTPAPAQYAEEIENARQRIKELEGG